MMIASFVLLGAVCAPPGLPALENAMPAHIAGPWRIAVGPGSVEVDGKRLTLDAETVLDIPPVQSVTVKGEKYDALPVFDPHAGAWRRGATLRPLITEECSATGLLDPASLVVKAAPDAAEAFVLGKDYQADLFWANIGRIEGGAIAADQAVYADYTYTPCRLDSIVITANGAVRLILGQPGMGTQLPVETSPGETAIVNVWVPGPIEALTEENLFPIELGVQAAAPQTPSQAERFLPKTLAKLRAGQPVTIVAWGDSVTNGGGVGAEKSLWYQQVFLERLKARFPKSDITLKTAAWGGGNSNGYMSAPAGGQYDFARDVLDPKPDLVTIEFVNDAYLQGEAMAQHYAVILKRLHGVGAEIALITPHLVRPDWMAADALKFEPDPRPYVQGLHQFAKDHDLALADASAEWCRLWRQGIPYITLLANSINHPDARGHRLFADVLMGLFPAE
ncbi:MAG TPA: SGNH/GDSL hydrolase family protein [Candidatus Hydrogenedentes bacterium]|nr:SGNH/GDSL hydrolase family protein [Candidatus Hydrogenedentota bacterium]HPG68376.1 SGNH/GDSL hydrolase family protein [Candidatus Hydrogenedentota bacterium]